MHLGGLWYSYLSIDIHICMCVYIYIYTFLSLYIYMHIYNTLKVQEPFGVGFELKLEACHIKHEPLLLGAMHRLKPRTTFTLRNGSMLIY